MYAIIFTRLYNNINNDNKTLYIHRKKLRHENKANFQCDNMTYYSTQAEGIHKSVYPTDISVTTNKKLTPQWVKYVLGHFM